MIHALSIVLLGASCRLATDVDSGIDLAPVVSAPVLRVGDTVRVIVTVTNERSEPITIEGNACNQHFEVRDGRGRITGPAEPIGCLGVHIPVQLDPGESHTFTGFWSGRLGESQSAQPRYAAPGTYHISGRVQLVSHPGSVTGGHVAIDVRAAAGE